MRCPSCGTENVPGSRFCSNCGHALEPSEPTQPVPPSAASEPTQPVPPSAASEPTRPVVPAPPPASPSPPSAPPRPGGFKLTPPMIAVGGAVLVVAIGLLVWALFLRGDDEPAVALPTPAGTPTSQPQPTGTTSATGATGAATGATGTTGSTGASGATGGAFTVSVNMCEDVSRQGRCRNPFAYDPAAGWTIPVTAPSYTVVIVTENLVVGDVISLDITDTASGETYYETEFDPAPEDVLDYEQWIYWLPLVRPQTGSFPPGSENELRFYRNGELIEFEGSNAFVFE